MTDMRAALRAARARERDLVLDEVIGVVQRLVPDAQARHDVILELTGLYSMARRRRASAESANPKAAEQVAEDGGVPHS